MSTELGLPRWIAGGFYSCLKHQSSSDACFQSSCFGHCFRRFNHLFWRSRVRLRRLVHLLCASSRCLDDPGIRLCGGGLLVYTLRGAKLIFITKEWYWKNSCRANRKPLSGGAEGTGVTINNCRVSIATNIRNIILEHVVMVTAASLPLMLLDYNRSCHRVTLLQ